MCWILFVGLLLWVVLLEPWMGFQFGMRGVLVVVMGAAFLAVTIALLLYGRRRVSHPASKKGDSEHHQA